MKRWWGLFASLGFWVPFFWLGMSWEGIGLGLVCAAVSFGTGILAWLEAEK